MLVSAVSFELVEEAATTARVATAVGFAAGAVTFVVRVERAAPQRLVAGQLSGLTATFGFAAADGIRSFDA